MVIKRVLRFFLHLYDINMQNALTPMWPPQIIHGHQIKSHGHLKFRKFEVDKTGGIHTKLLVRMMLPF